MSLGRDKLHRSHTEGAGEGRCGPRSPTHFLKSVLRSTFYSSS